MDSIGSVLSVAESLLSATQSPVFKEISFIFGYCSELQNLNNTVATVRAVLQDAQAKEDGLSNEARFYIQRLKYAVYDADDLLDKFATLAHQKKQLGGGKFSKEVRAFFSPLNQLGVAYAMSRGIKEIRRTLDAITSDHHKYGIGLGNTERPIVRRNKETCSWVNEKDIFGREGDKKAVIDMLLDPNVEGDVSFVTIVGIGGLGKTALAQLVYNDKVIESAFPLRMWVCVSDQDPKRLDIKAVLLNIVESATKKKCEGLQLDLVQNKLRKELEGKKYLLVLDDVWIEDRNQCIELNRYLMGGQMGSRILVTTRSKRVAQVIGDGRSPYELQALSKEDSWNLFKRLAFEQSQANPNPDLVKIGEEIVKECANVPLAIRMMGTLLHGRSKMEWQAIQKKAIAKIGLDGDITHVLKLSYYHLDTRLKSCFSYCAVFPKDYVMHKVKLISLWIAQGYLEPFNDSESLINDGEECFSTLLGRCFFQDVVTNEYGEIVSCKMHDLIHDLAQNVAGNEICNAYSITRSVNQQVRHVFAVKLECDERSFPSTKIRTYIRDTFLGSPSMNALLRNWKNLRTLDLNSLGIKELPCEISNLLHLRYLDLSWNHSLQRLSKEISKLCNLQTLLLRECNSLKELPGDVSKLVKLNVLDIKGCDSLRYMPCGMDKLSGLCILTLFVVGEVKSSKKKQGVGRLDDIAALDDLKGKLRIDIRSNVKGNDKGGFLMRKESLTEIELMWSQNENDENKVVNDKALAEGLQPNPNLKRLGVRGYGDTEMPSWAIDEKLQTSLPNLVKLKFWNCKGVEDLPVLGRLGCLKYLDIDKMLNLKYMEKGSCSSYGGGEEFFPSLEGLYLCDLPKLKGWWRGDEHMDDDERNDMSISFPRLCKLNIQHCPLLTSVPLCPTVERLELENFNERIKIMKEIKSKDENGEVDTPQHKLRDVETDDVGYLKSLPMPAAFQSLSELFIHDDNKVENLREVEDVFRSCSSSLKMLHIYECRVRSMSGALEHLTALQQLYIRIHADIINDNVIRCRLEEEDEVPWSALQNCLHKLDINYMPRGIRHLTSLHVLVLTDGNRVKEIPEWISYLSSLHTLQVWHVSQELEWRCKRPDGIDWPKIQHITNLKILS